MNGADQKEAHEPDARLAFHAIHALRGPNIWSHSPILEAWVDLGELCDTSSDEVPGFNDRVMSWLPSLVEHRCSLGERGGFLERLRRGTYPAHVLEHVTLELQSLAGTHVGYGKARTLSVSGWYRVVVRYVDEAMGRVALAEARRLLLAAYDDQPFDVVAAVARVRSSAAAVSLDPAVTAIRRVARERRIPSLLLGSGGLVQLGYGAVQRRVQLVDGVMSDRTSAVAESIASDRALYRPMLKDAGIPVPEWQLVESADEAWTSAEDLGLPVIVKPFYRDHHPAISGPLSDRALVTAAFEAAREVSSHVAVERVVPGRRFSLLVIAGRLVAAVAQAGGVAGGLSKNVHFIIQANDKPHAPHPELTKRVLEAVRLVGLDIAAVGVVADTLDRPLEEQGGVIASVDARPRLGPFLLGTRDESDPVAAAVVDVVFPAEATGRVPLVAVTGGSERGEVAARLARVLGRSGKTPGIAGSSGVAVAGRALPGRWSDRFEATQSVLMNPKVDAIVVEVGRRDILVEGLGFDRCQVAVVCGLDMAAELPLAGWGFDEPEAELPRAERCLVEAVLPGGCSIVNAEMPGALEMAQHARGDVLFCGPPAAIERINPRGRWLRGEAGRIVLGHAEEQVDAIEYSNINISNNIVMPVIAAAWALGLDLRHVFEWLAEGD